MTVLGTQQQWALPLLELSSLCVSRAGASRVLGVGDEAFAVMQASIANVGIATPGEATPLDGVLAAEELASPDGSEFEGVSLDDDGNVYILREGPSVVLVLDAGLTTVRTRI